MTKDKTKFNKKWKLDPKTQCWEWTAGKFQDGYGQFKFNGAAIGLKAHRAAWILYKGPIPKGNHLGTMCVCHTCDNPPCVNPKHLFLGTHQDNMDDKVNKGRSMKGVKHNLAKLTESQVLEIRAKYNGFRKRPYLRELAEEHGVDPTMISLIVNRKNWTHI